MLAGNMSMCKIDTFGEESAMINNDIYPAMTSACPRLCTKVILNRVIELKWLQQFYTLGGVGNSVLQIVFENSVQMNKVLSLHLPNQLGTW